MMKLIKAVFKFTAWAFAALLLAAVAFYAYLISQPSTKQGEITWESCYRPSYVLWFMMPPPKNLQCATVSVPVDAAKPNGKQFTIPLTRLPTSNPNPIGDLLLLNGGPGGNSVDVHLLISDDKYGASVKNSFNIIGYAPRGITPSTPTLNCGGLEADENGQAYMQACLKHTGADILPFIGSKYVVQDLDSIRQKLGLETWSMIGYSYGTKLVAQYAEHYPERLRAGIADGVVDTSENLYTITLNQMTGAQAAFDAMVKKHCADNSCVLDRSKDLNQSLVAKLKEIEQKNLTDILGKRITAKKVLKMFMDNLNDESSWENAMSLLKELSNGETKLYNITMLTNKWSERSMTIDALTLVNCADYAYKMSKEDYLAQSRKLDQAVRFDNIKTLTENDYLDACYHWPWQVGDNLSENLVTENTPNLLFVSHENDFATPLPNAQTMAKRFDDPLIIFKNKRGHTVSLLSDNACINQYSAQYLLNPKMKFENKVLECK